MVLATFQSLHYELILHHQVVKTKNSRVILSGIYHVQFFHLSAQRIYRIGQNEDFASQTLALWKSCHPPRV